MALHCGKALLYFYNLIYLGAAAVFVYLAVAFVKAYGDYSRVTSSLYAIVPAGIILGIAIILFIVAIIGFCGTCTENRCCLSVFFTLLLILFIFEITASAIGYKKRTEISDDVKIGLNEAIKEYYLPKERSIRIGFDKLQRQLKCCGVEKAEDWKSVGAGSLPLSCCVHSGGECSFAFPANYYETGCYYKLINVLRDNLKYLAGVGIGFGIFQVVGMIGVCYLIYKTRKGGYMKIGETTRA